MPRIYYIYHLPGKKVGCTSNIQRRFKEYRMQGYTGPIVILEKLNCGIKEAGDREWLWSDKFGYRRGWHYSLTYASNPVKAMMKFGKTKANPRWAKKK